MPQRKTPIRGVFAEMIGKKPDKTKAHELLNNIQHEMSADETIALLSTEYLTLIKENIGTFQKLARLEELMMMKKLRSCVAQHIKLSVVRNYIYARCPFYRIDKKMKDIRVIIGTTDGWGDDLQALLCQEKFMKMAARKLARFMDEQIDLRTQCLDQELHNNNTLHAA